MFIVKEAGTLGGTALATRRVATDERKGLTRTAAAPSNGMGNKGLHYEKAHGTIRENRRVPYHSGIRVNVVNAQHQHFHNENTDYLSLVTG